ncbi:histidinol-phosphate transaminase [Novilysobacter defluvii]|uniref:Histidinol-phosphate aminotransferase n=1 Tax=Lysobacter defluvii IMMIB APB-9 = DSM 18482 TaxID=1385515 RepID=A0A0A0MBR9_9GAMM|nr:histidinol-phosphate transaminase [Lysobacter defluvii]KGO99051.1 histidinol-phosphate aminotransferase [Lysobacter defluvii IMMIB APB-9 = DSM 18482]
MNMAVDRSGDPLNLVRPDLLGFEGYRSARVAGGAGREWLNANEAAWPNPVDPDARLRRYPDPQPQALRERLAALYGCDAGQLLLTRGSDEAIDLLVRALCRPGGDAVVVCPPTFGMYAVCARLHGSRVLELPLVEGPGGFACALDEVATLAEASRARLVMLCSPGNPTGHLVPLEAIDALAWRLQDRAMLVVDEAYIEFAEAPSATTLLPRRRNLAVLRTLSKAHALAGLRLGSVIADPALVRVLARCQAPYPLPAPSVEQALQALEHDVLEATRARVEETVAGREALRAALGRLPGIRTVYPSSGNFLLVRFTDAAEAFDRLLGACVVVRDQRHVPGLEDALRITVGTPEQNRRVLDALAGAEAAA